MFLPLVHNLHYSWTGWIEIPAIHGESFEKLIVDLDPLWLRDGMIRKSHVRKPDCIQITFKAKPHLSPHDITRLAKGRLSHSLRSNRLNHRFSRKVSLRAIGENRIETVLDYVSQQLCKTDLVDSRYIERLREVHWENKEIDLNQPLKVSHGRYWYDLHIVVVTNNRVRIGDRVLLERIKTCILAMELFQAKSISMMPDHIHIACRGKTGCSPEEIATVLWSGLNQAAGFNLYSATVYMGTFSVYTLGAVR